VLTRFCHTRWRDGTRCCVIQRRDHNASERTVMIIKSATRSAVGAVCLTTNLTLSSAHAQMGGGTAPGSYWPPPGAYGRPSGPYAAPGPHQPLWPSPGAYGPAPGSYAPQSQYVPPPVGPQVITNGPQTNPGDVSPSGERTLRQAAQGKPGVPPGAYAQGMRPDHRSAATSAVPRQLCSILALRR
jgi:hypothetical protein